MWKVHKFISADPTDGGKGRIPPLMKGGSKVERDNEGKSRMLHKAFFRSQREIEMEEEGEEEWEEKFMMNRISNEQIWRAIRRL